MTKPSDELLRLALGDAIAGPSPPGRTYYQAAPVDLLPDPNCYVVYTVDMYGNADLLTDLVDVNIDVYGFTGGGEAGPSAVNATVAGIHEALQGKILSDTGGSITSLHRTRRQPLPTDDARVTRTRLTYTATWASQDTADSLDPGGIS